MHLPPFTSETAKIAAKKSVSTRRAIQAAKLEAALNGQANAKPAQIRNFRLWMMLEKIDKRIGVALKRAKLDEAAKLAAIAKAIRGQIDGESAAAPRARTAPPAAPPLPDLP